jgi:hypothetical protein
MDRALRLLAHSVHLAVLVSVISYLAPASSLAADRSRTVRPAAVVQRAPAASQTLSGPGLWHVVDSAVDPVQRPAILRGSRSLWCGKYDPCWPDSIGYPNFAYEVLYIDTGSHRADYSLSVTMIASSELFYDYMYLIGGGGGATDPIGNNSDAIDLIVATGSSGNARLLTTWTGSIHGNTPGAGSIDTTPGPVVIMGSNGGEPDSLTATIHIAAVHRALYFVFQSDCLYSSEDGLWPYGPGALLDDLITNDNGAIYTDAAPTGGTDAFGGSVIAGTPGAPTISSRARSVTNQSPSISAPANQTRNEGEMISLTTTATDPDVTDQVRIDAIGYPFGLTLTSSVGNTASATLSGTLTCAAAGSPYTISWCVSSPFHEDVVTTVLTVQADPHAPVVTARPSVTRAVGSLLDFEVTASDPDGDAIGNLTADLSTLPPGDNATFTAGPTNQFGTLHWALNPGDEGDYVVRFIASNALTGCASTLIHVVPSGITGVAVDDRALSAPRLEQNRPNPFNPRTSIPFNLPREARVVLDIFDIRGHRVIRLLDRVFAAGSWNASWDGRDARGREVPSGVYLDRMQAAGVSVSRRMVILR